jgi:hypothetical protein
MGPALGNYFPPGSCRRLRDRITAGRRGLNAPGNGTEFQWV